MGMCPLCNGFKKIHLNCPNCNGKMENKGREAEYYDEYSPYMPIDQMKLEDGYPTDYSKEECPHLFRCPICGTDQIVLIKE